MAQQRKIAVKLLDVYLLKRFVLALAASIIALLLIAVVVDLIENMNHFIDHQATKRQVILYYFYHTPYWIVLTLPVSSLLGTLFALTSFARRNEITAMKAAGISLYRLLLPLFVFALLFSGLVYLFTDKIVPTANYHYHAVWDQIRSINRSDGSRAQILLQDTGGQLLFARSYDASKNLAHDILWERQEDYSVVERLTANRLQWHQDHWIAQAGTYYRLSPPPPPIQPVSSEQNPPLSPATPIEQRRSDHLPLLPADPSHQEGKPDETNASIPYSTTTPFDELRLDHLSLLPADLSRQERKPDEMNYRQLASYIARTSANGEDVTRHLVDLHLKVAFPFTCFIIVLLGAPLAANTRQADLANNFGRGILICFVFYACVKAGQALGWNKVLSPLLGAWLVNLLFSLWGMTLLWRAHK